jgi:indolepyruvate ferredoxin oxidoreductase
MAIRAAVAAGSNITYKILYNDVVAMTGGQPIDGAMTVPRMAQQVLAEGVAKCVVVSVAPDVHRRSRLLPRDVVVYPREDLDEVQRVLRRVSGVTVLIYEQMCAAEKRRKIKRGKLPATTRRVFINSAVCEGCGDCSVKSNCMSIQPKETPLGRKRTIDQSTCNDDASCVQGFCPSFVQVRDAVPSARFAAKAVPQSRKLLPAPNASPLASHYNVVVAGIGGTGVVTIGAVLAMAAHLEGRGSCTYNMTGLAQKGGPVYSHLRFVPSPDDITAARVDVADADLLIVCDLLTALAPEALQTIERGRTRAVVNRQVEPSGAFQLFPDSPLPGASELAQLELVVGADHVSAIDATSFANTLMGDTIAANMFMVGYAYQMGLLPLSNESIVRAIELNGVAVAFNLNALDLGRRVAAGERKLPNAEMSSHFDRSEHSLSTEELVSQHFSHLAEYQDARYAERYKRRIAVVRAAEHRVNPGSDALTRAAARSYGRLMAYKDEYEVARLYSSTKFRDDLAQTFAGRPKFEVLLAPPALFGSKRQAGAPRKRAFGPWIFMVFRLLTRLKGLRGTPFDVFGFTAERRMERRLVAEYGSLLEEILASLRPENHALAVRLAEFPDAIRGFGHIKALSVARAEQAKSTLLSEFRAA